MNCPYCKHPLHAGETYCTYCGKPVHTTPSFFRKHGKEIVGIGVVICLVFSLLFFMKSYSSNVKGMYAMYDETGNTVFTLSLKVNGTYTIEDKQNYSGYASGEEAPLVILHHDFSVSKEGLKWAQEMHGKYAKTDQNHVYRIPSFFGGLFEESEDAFFVYTDSVLYLYSAKDDQGITYRLVRI